MRAAEELELRSIAFPAISTGIFGYPMDQAAGVAIAALTESLRRARHITRVQMVLYDKSALDVFAQAALAGEGAAGGDSYHVSIGACDE